MRASISTQELINLMTTNSSVVVFELEKHYGYIYYLTVNGVDLECVSSERIDNSEISNRVKNLSINQQSFNVNQLAKYVETTYTNSNMTVTYSYYDSSSKNTLYNQIVLNYTEPQDTTFTSAEWI